MEKLNPYLGHNYLYLMKRWRVLCEESGLKFFPGNKKYSIVHITSPSLTSEGAIYLSAGIHGDEPGSVVGLLSWAEKNHHQLAQLPLLIYPCINPWGLLNNSRLNIHGVDLNRCWGDSQSLFVSKIMDKLAGIKCSLSLCLHEDYDGQGIYLYAPGGSKKVRKSAAMILSAGEKFIPRDPRKKIDGRKCTEGMICPRPSKPPEDGIPEALFLYGNCGKQNFTLETPSEFAIEQRIAAQVAMITQAINCL